MTLAAFVHKSAVNHKSPVNQNSSVHPWESCPKIRDLGIIRPWASIREGGPGIIKHGVPRMEDLRHRNTVCHDERGKSHFLAWVEWGGHMNLPALHVEKTQGPL